MTTAEKTVITVSAHMNVPVELAWQLWNSPEHITKWNQASADWHTPKAENDLKPGGRFTSRMEAKDGSMGFDFGGTYNTIRPNEYLAYTMDDDRKVTVSFKQKNNGTEVIETFEAEDTHSPEMQQAGWQAILNSFAAYAEKIAASPLQ